MELVSGGELLDKLPESKPYLDEDDARLATRELILALEYLHGNGIIHRDIKPENLAYVHSRKETTRRWTTRVTRGRGVSRATERKSAAPAKAKSAGKPQGEMTEEDGATFIQSMFRGRKERKSGNSLLKSEAVGIDASNKTGIDNHAEQFVKQGGYIARKASNVAQYNATFEPSGLTRRRPRGA